MHFYCPTCKNYLGLYNPNVHAADSTYTCTYCVPIVPRSSSMLLKNNFFFLCKKIAPQLTHFFEKRNLWKLIEKGKCRLISTENIRSEIYTGELYKKLKDFVTNSYNFTMAFNTDGVQVFKSSKFSIWPLFCTINELDFDKKAHFIVLNALWFGIQKPNPNAFCRPFVDETKLLFKDGFKWIDKHANGIERVSRILFPICVADAPARAMLLNFMQYNGSYGCNYCEHPGITVDRGDGHARVFPLVFPIPAMRTCNETLLHAIEAIDSGATHVNGVKGFSILSLIPKFD